MQKNLSERRVELDIIKAWAIIAVVVIHTVSLSYQYYPRESWSWDGLLIIDQISRFCVPIFVALSGYGLGIRNMDIGWNYSVFIKRRVVKLFPWYLFWSGVIYLYIRTSEEWNHVEHFSVWKLVLLGKADYHLYFVPMIVSLYFIFPILAFALKKWGWKLVAGLGVFEAILYLVTSLEAEKYIHFSFAWGDQQQYLFFGTWIFYFALGIYLNFMPRLSVKKSYVLKLIAIVCLVGGLVLILTDTLRLAASGADIIAATRFTRLPVLVFATGAILGSIVWRDFWHRFPGVFVWLGERSFMVYLSHTLVLREVSKIIKPDSLWNLGVLVVVTVMLSTVMSEMGYQLGGLLGKRLKAVLKIDVNDIN